METGVQSALKALKRLDSGFRRNNVRKTQIDFFTASLSQRGKTISPPFGNVIPAGQAGKGGSGEIFKVLDKPYRKMVRSYRV